MAFGKNSRRRPASGASARAAVRAVRAMYTAEPLEGRVLLTQYVVNSLLDVVAADGVVTLREAIQAANTNAVVNEARAGSATGADVIGFDPSLFAAGPAKIVLGGSELQITGLTIIDGPGRDVLTIDGDARSRVFNIALSSNTTITDVTVSGGSTQLDGGGVYSLGTLAMSNVTATLNSAQGKGGGVYSAHPLTMAQCTAANNRAGKGGGLFVSGGATLTDVVISGNFSNGDGGGVFAQGGLNATDVTVWGNSAFQSGGGIATTASIVGMIMANVTISNNAAAYGGGVWNTGSAYLRNTTISANAAAYGGGVFTTGANETTVASNTIIAGNLTNTNGPDIDGSLASGSDYNLIGIADATQTAAAGSHSLSGTSDVPLDPGLGELTELTGALVVPLLPGSPAINAGSNALARDPSYQLLASDQIGNPRIADGTVDIGAVEGATQPRPGVTYVVTSLADEVAQDGVLTFREALDAAALNTPVGDAAAGSFRQQDRITFAPGLAGIAQVNSGSFTVEGNLSIDGPGPDKLTFSGDGHSRTLWVTGGTTASISGATIAGGAGGVFNNGALTLANVQISGNTADYGGGIRNAQPATLRLSDASLTNNKALYHDGALYNFGSIDMRNCSVSGNISAGSGGGITNYDVGTLTMANVTIAGNSAATYGGGISSAGKLAVTNTLVAGNISPTDPDLHGQMTAGSDYNLIGALDPSQLASAGAHILSGTAAAPLDPKLGPLTTINGLAIVPLLAGSPAINAGSNALAVDADGNPLATDAAGQPRIAGGTVDIEAYEYQPQPLLVSGTSGNDTISITGDASKLNWNINSAGQLSIPRSLVTALHIDASQGTDTLSFDFDLLDDDLIIQANPATRRQLFQAASDAVKAARNTTPLWSGHGITSSTAAGDALHGLAAILNEKLDLQGNPTPILGTLDGQTLDTNSIIVKHVLNGDANLDGIVNFDDYFLINTGFLSGGALGGYRNGDFNYDAVVNFDDYLMINTAFLGQSGAKPSAPATALARPALRVAKAGRRLHLLKRVRGGASRR